MFHVSSVACIPQQTHKFRSKALYVFCLPNAAFCVYSCHCLLTHLFAYKCCNAVHYQFSKFKLIPWTYVGCNSISLVEDLIGHKSLPIGWRSVWLQIIILELPLSPCDQKFPSRQEESLMFSAFTQQRGWSHVLCCPWIRCQSLHKNLLSMFCVQASGYCPCQHFYTCTMSASEFLNSAPFQ